MELIFKNIGHFKEYRALHQVVGRNDESNLGCAGSSTEDKYSAFETKWYLYYVLKELVVLYDCSSAEIGIYGDVSMLGNPEKKLFLENGTVRQTTRAWSRV